MDGRKNGLKKEIEGNIKTDFGSKIRKGLGRSTEMFYKIENV